MVFLSEPLATSHAINLIAALASLADIGLALLVGGLLGKEISIGAWCGGYDLCLYISPLVDKYYIAAITIFGISSLVLNVAALSYTNYLGNRFGLKLGSDFLFNALLSKDVQRSDDFTSIGISEAIRCCNLFFIPLFHFCSRAITCIVLIIGLMVVLPESFYMLLILALCYFTLFVFFKKPLDVLSLANSTNVDKRTKLVETLGLEARRLAVEEGLEYLVKMVAVHEKRYGANQAKIAAITVFPKYFLEAVCFISLAVWMQFNDGSVGSNVGFWQ